MIKWRTWTNFVLAGDRKGVKVVEICLDDIEAIEGWTDETCMIYMKSGKNFWVLHTKDEVRAFIDKCYADVHAELARRSL